VKLFIKLLGVFVLCGVCTIAVPTQAQPGKPKKAAAKSVKGEPKEAFTLLYKPQLGTLLYDIKTSVRHNIGDGKIQFSVLSDAQLAINNTVVNVEDEEWTFERYYSKLNTLLSAEQLQMDHDSIIRENGAINRILRARYSWIGEELGYRRIDSLRLSDEAQFMYYYQGQHLIIPLSKEQVVPGDTWTNKRLDTVAVRDGIYVYDVSTTYTFDRLVDTLGGTSALIIGKHTGAFTGMQKAGEETLQLSGPISGTDTTYLNLYTGTIILERLMANIPVTGESSGGGKVSDMLNIVSTIQLNGTNLRNKED